MFSCVLVAVAAAHLPAQAQTVIGRTVAAQTEAPIRGVFVTLLPAADIRSAAQLSGENGEFTLRAPSPGRYVLRAEMIGYRSVERTVELDTGETVEEILRLPLDAIDLGALAVQAPRERRCEIAVGQGDALSRLWSAARKALERAEWTEESGWVSARGYTYQRVLDLVDLEILDEQVTPHPVLDRRAFVGPDPAVARSDGFVRKTDGGATIYEGADAALLLSDDFLDTHCFHLRRESEALIGLAFEPVPDRDVVEITGVLWLDAETAQLHSLEYQYLDHPLAFPVPTSRYGGFAQFRHLPGGGVMVERWWIRMPKLLAAANHPSVRYCGMSPCDDRESLRQLSRAGLAVQESGGAVLSVRLPDGQRLPAVDRAAIAGIVVDSTAPGAPEPLSGAEVVIRGTEHRAVTDAQGRFRLDNLAEGVYSLSFRHPRLDQLAIDQPQAISVQAVSGELARTGLATPSPATLALLRCNEEARRSAAEAGEPNGAALASREGGGRGTALVHGVVRDIATGEGIPGASVRLFEPAGATPIARATTDVDGRYRFCAAPPGPLSVSTEFLGRSEARIDVTAVAAAPTTANVDWALSAPGRIVGRVIQLEGGGGVPGAVVRIRGSGQQVVTDARGQFAFDSAPTGEITLETEHLAYRPSRGSFALSADEVVRIELNVADRVFDLDPITVQVRSRRGERLGGFYERQRRGMGTFLDRADLEGRGQTVLTEVLREVSGIEVRSPTGTQRLIVSGRQSPSLGGFITSGVDPSIQNPQCAPMIYLDGVKITSRTYDIEDIYDSIRMIDAIPVSDIVGVEVYAGAASVPGRFAGLDTGCGVIAVWTSALEPR